MRLRQVNLNKAKLANFALSQLIRNDDYTVYLIQEPRFYRNRIPLLPKGYSVFGKSTSRAVIIAPSSMPLFMCHEFSCDDFTVCLYDDGKNKKYLVSVYLDITYRPVVNTHFTKVLESFERLDAEVIFGLDCNGHSTLWGCAETNNRGEILEEMIFQHNLKILNVGNDPTFQNSRFTSIIDISLTLGKSDDVYGWHVSKHHLHSDHFMIEFYFLHKKISPTMIKKVNWNAYIDNLQLADCSYNLWTPVTIETEANNLVKAMKNALFKSSFSVPLKAKNARWWNQELNSKWLEVNKLNREFLHSPNASRKANYRSAKKQLMKDIRSAKRQNWKQFCDQINDPNSMALLNRILKQGPHQKIGLLKKPDGTFAKDFKESINLLMDEHFPRSVPLSKKGTVFTPSCNIQKGHFCSSNDLDHSFITEAKVADAINSFGSFKAAGLDDLKPIALKYFIKHKVGLKRLTTLFKAIIYLGYTPEKWCHAKVIFIPKPGKSDYSELRSFRPISLLSFLFKTVERLVMWETETKYLRLKPVSSKQHAFRKGFSTETALSCLVNEIEEAIFQKHFALCVNVDISGAFDGLSYRNIISSLHEKNVSNSIINWYKEFLYNRVAHVQFSDKTLSYKLKQGTPQGGILSSMLWNLSFDDFISKINDGPIRVHCYADDSALLITGPDPNSMVEKMQNAINKAFLWGKTKGLKFVPEKTTATFFCNQYRKRNFKLPKALHMNGTPISYTDSVKHLGIWLDSSLSWSLNLNKKITSAKLAFMKIRNAIGSIWGPSPRALKWAIDGIIMPMLLYGCVVWGKNAIMQTKLRKLHRIMLLSMMCVRKSTPTQGIEVITNMIPIHLRIKDAALKGMLRILPRYTSKWCSEYKSLIGHLQWGTNELKQLGISDFDFDKCNVLNVDRNFMVDQESFKSGLPTSDCIIKCYTDGSKLGGHTGFGYAITNGPLEEASDYGYLGTKSTVFQAEVTAIAKCAEHLSQGSDPEAIIYSDSQAAIAALVNLNIKHKTVQNCISVLNDLGLTKKITIAWVKAHANHPGNEFADALAKSGTMATNKRVEIPTPLQWAKAKISAETIKDWNQEWWDYKDADGKPIAEQTKIWFPSTDFRNSQSLLNLGRHELSLAVQLITGHNLLNYHQWLINPGEHDPTCRFCLHEDEDAWHIIGRCPKFLEKRNEAFYTRELVNPPIWSTKQFSSFMRKAKLDELNHGEFPSFTIH